MREPIPVLPQSDMGQESVERFETHGLVALIAAFVSKSLFVRPHKVAMPGEEDPVAMYVHGLVYVDGDKVIETSLCCWGP
jgi:hypothetical protein